MAQTANKYRLGVFFTVGSLALVLIIVWLTGGLSIRQENRFVCYFSWSVQGLNEGSSVMYNGVPVGSIESINIAPDGRLVEVIMGIRMDFRMDSTIVATMQVTGITGLQVVNLSSDTSDTVEHPVYSFDLDYPVIPVAEGAFQAVSSTLTRMAEIIYEVDFGGISDQVETLLKNVNALLDSEMITNIEESILRTSANLDTLLNVYTTLGTNLNRLTLQLEGVTPELVSGLDSLVQTMNGLTSEMQGFIRNMDELAVEGTDALRNLSVFFDLIGSDPGQLIMPATREGVWR
jgi:ABC-type transporter Mla subunit MlaD